ncbi:hypothetical protein [Aquicella lusitana]|uniref:Uncharacterized protein n=1 Tax=Aquicella lusitana TaxID=254246 RepID=A0A370GJY7_9COXI|nr:hypothetical protein [Aquicella lusitana]RDI42704.1 hypothetical protein C8D86_11333 [Aquicella lusitana]
MMKSGRIDLTNNSETPQEAEFDINQFLNLTDVNDQSNKRKDPEISQNALNQASKIKRLKTKFNELEKIAHELMDENIRAQTEIEELKQKLGKSEAETLKEKKIYAKRVIAKALKNKILTLGFIQSPSNSSERDQQLHLGREKQFKKNI